MRVLALSLLLAAACQERSGPAVAAATPLRPAAAASAPASDAAAGDWTAAQQACVDQWLEAHALDPYGSPKGTMYTGGTPLFDEASGQRLSRQAFLAAHHPDALRACGF